MKVSAHMSTSPTVGEMQEHEALAASSRPSLHIRARQQQLCRKQTLGILLPCLELGSSSNTSHSPQSASTTVLKASLLRNELILTVDVFTKMLQNGMCPDNYTLPFLLKACARMQRCRLGELVHGFCLKLGFVSDIFVGDSLIDTYCAFDNVKRALYVFDEMPSLSAVSWMVMISGIAKVDNLDMARLFFDEAPGRDRGV
ncbi:hypothetical protein C1H46_045249 [Malus baccata]|uniref:Pentatricopeptide repeat-containing protein n=1 Tax=Malus baccata TaxID=106549 RepID=A0A540K4R4_MALBA|nr:hypothetical protein C1H46_045249 [Malus baccata]